MVRADIPAGVQAAQLIHAAGRSSPGNLSPFTYAIALQVDGEISLRALYARLRSAGVAAVLVIEDDPPYTGQAMAIGIPPGPRRPLRPYLSNLALVTQPGRVPGVMTRAVPGSNPGERATNSLGPGK